MEIRAEWTKPVPDGWEQRLREISPIVDRTSHLRFRWRASVEQWELYACQPAHLLAPDRCEQLAVHWSELPPSQQMGRKTFVTEYQHYMFRTYKVEARRFWVLQGEHGGTPATFSDRECRILEAMNESSDVPPLGCFPYAPFDERAVKAIQARDKLLQAGNDLDRLERQRRPDQMKAMDDETEKAHRKAFVEWHSKECQPMAEFMKWYHRQAEAVTTLAPAPSGLNNAVSQWRDTYIEHGYMPSVGQ